nr:putative lrr receptor-like serine/threonine-protein kinase [Quercus suber]
MDFSFELFAGIRLGCLPRGGLKLEDGEMSLWKEEYTRGNPIFAGVGLGCLPYGFLWWAWTSFLEDRLGVADPQINLLNSGCSQYNVSDVSNFYTNLNATFSDLRTQLNNNKYFATAQQVKGSESAYTLVQCRNYLSNADCLACFTAAVSQIRNCSAANGARVIYDGCFLRYESNIFFDQTTLPGNQGYCGNRTASQPLAFSTAADGLLKDLQVATPRINGFFAASKREVVDSSGNATVYAVAQCVETATESGCQNCLNVASNNIQACVPNGDGRAVDAGCFLRRFKQQECHHWRSSWRWRSKEVRRGDILGATELRGPVNYKYNDLKSATKNFCEENKLGEGGFGDVYKGTLKNGKMVAVKKLAIGQSSRAKADFENFGLARLLPEDQTHLSTKFAGTLGYTAPEYAIHGQLSEKVDTYSFGVIVLEIICGRKTSEVQHAFDGDYLLERAWKLYENNKHSELVDETLNPEEYIAEEVKKMVEIALMCTQSSASVRPSMSEVVVLLKGKGSMENRPPTKPGYVNTDRKICGDTSTSTGSSTSNATASISQRPAR